MPHIQIDNKNFAYIHEQQKRKTITISVKSCCKIIIKTPQSVSNKEALQILHRYSTWISKKNSAYEQLSNDPPINNTYILYRGKKLHIKLASRYETISFPMINNNNIIIPHTDSLFLPLDSLFIPWYKQEAKIYLTQRTVFWSKKLSVYVSRISIRDQKSRWGSCSSLHNINYNWRIMMAPDNIIDYLVIHETAHLLQMNHSIKFWSIVKRLDPDFQKHRLWLRQHGDIILHVLR
ncbi:M48 family metallopeptidase [Pectinatus sottacetonis]|uniref:M48 family metallopeptidase n=1 Tax=Pectinatus sottacetonis TaxID=1002795 RepID=UPI0018C7D2DC|nr:SprT family zinc-dependent metalloprotease [Pectinatus sottacetonis]